MLGLTPDNLAWVIRSVLTHIGAADKDTSPWADLAALLLAQVLAVILLGLVLAGLWLAARVFKVEIGLDQDPKARALVLAALIISFALVIAGAG